MSARHISSAEREVADALADYSQTYLRDYWPENPGSPDGWADNAVLMLGYQDAALAVLKHFNGRAVSLLDISTGPALAPLLGMITAVSDAQLSDFHEINRQALEHLPIEYWRNYVPMLIKLFDRPETKSEEILARLDVLRSARKPVPIDLLRDDVFPASVRPHDFELISMNFVADGITSTEDEYLRCLGRATDMVRPGGAFVMSGIVDSTHWQLGSSAEPSPNVSEKTICDFIASQGMEILGLSRSMRLRGLTYSGGWIVLAAARKTR